MGDFISVNGVWKSVGSKVPKAKAVVKEEPKAAPKAAPKKSSKKKG